MGKRVILGIVFFSVLLIILSGFVSGVTLNVIPSDLSVKNSATADLIGEVAHLQTTGIVGSGDEARIVIQASDIGISTLNDLTSISWDVSSGTGYAPHVDVFLDNGKTLVFEYAKVDPIQCDDSADYPTGNFNTFNDKGIVDNSAYAWLSSGPPGPCGDPTFDANHNSLTEWKGTDGSAGITKIEIEIDNWISQSEANVDNIIINGINYYISIQDAIGDAIASDTINVATGTYNATSVITIDKSLTIQGTGIDSTIITGKTKDGSIQNGADLMFDVQANNVVIKDMTIDLGDDDSDFDVGIYTGNDAGIHDLTIDNSKFLYASFGNAIGEQLIHLGGGTGTNNIIIQNSIFDTASGNSVWYVGDFALTGLTITSNIITNVVGIDADGGGTAFNQMAPVTNSVISDNNFTNTGIAVYLGSGSTSTSGITVSGNIFTSTAGFLTNYGALIITSEVDGVSTESITITGNTFDATESNGAITIFDSNTPANADVDGASITILNNNFLNNIVDAVSVGAGVSGTVNATLNYWGTTVKSTIQGLISGLVDFEPYYVDSGLITLSNIPPTVDVSLDVLSNIQFVKDAIVTDGGSGIATYLWTSESGPGTITFGSASAEGTTVSADTDGVYVIRLTVTDNAENTGFDEFQLTWDTTAPVITILGNDPETVEVDTIYADASATALDNIDGDVTLSIITNISAVDTSTLGSYDVTYTVTDSAGNQAIDIRTVNIVDTTVPVITRLGNEPETVEVGDVYTDAGATALDNYDGDVTVDIVVVNPVDVNTLGSYIVTYNVMDSSGNPAIEVTRTVNVVDTTAPIVTEVTPVTTPTNNNIPSYTFNTDEDGTISYSTCTSSTTSAVLGDNTITFDTLADGTYSICTITITDASGNPSTPLTITSFTVDTTTPYLTSVSITGAYYNGTHYFFSPVNQDGVYDNVSIDLEYSETVDYSIDIENSMGAIVRNLYSGTAKNPQPKIWDGTMDDLSTFVPDGVYTINTTITDPSSNTNTTYVATVYVDNTVPSVTVNSPLTQSYTTDTILFNITATDSNVISACWYSLNTGATNVSLTNSVGNFWTNTNSSMIQGSHTVNYYCDDTLGNLNNTKQVTFFIDSIIPIIEYTTGTENNDTYFSRDWIFVNVSVTEINEDTITFSLFNSTSLVNEISYTDSTRTINWTGLPNEVYYYNVSVNDSENSINQTETRTITLDTVHPQVSIIEPQNINYTTDSLEINFIASDDNALDSCWYTDDDGTTNHTLTGCANTTYTASQGTTLMILYVKDVAGNENSSSVTFFVDSIFPNIVGFSPSETTPVIRAGESQDFSITTAGNTLTYEWFVNSVLNSTTGSTFTFNSSVVEDVNIRVNITDILNNTAFKEWLLIVTEIPVTRTFTGGETTDLSQVADISAVVDFTLATGEGKISFGDEVLDLSNVLDLDNNVKIENGIVAINTIKYTQLDKPANITLTGLSYTSVPEIFYNAGFTTNANQITSKCDFCNIVSYTPSPTTDGTLVFEVEHFSSFKVGGSGEEFDLDLLDGLDKCDEGIQGNLEIDIKDPDEGDDFKIGEEIKIDVEVTNNADEDKDIIVEATLYNINDDDDEEQVESNDLKIDEGEDLDFELLLKVAENLEEKDDYLIFVKAYEEDEEDTQCNQEIVSVNIEREEHNVVIKNIMLNPQMIYQGKNLEIIVKVENIGSNDEDDVYISAESEELGISNRSEFFELEEFGEDDSSSVKTLLIKTPYGAEEGTYEIKVRVNFDDGFDEKIETFYVAGRVVVVPEIIFLTDLSVEEFTEPEEPSIDSIDLTETTLPEQKQRFFAGLNLILIISILILVILILITLWRRNKNP
ncbi:MAG: DUF5011 domain-containing protein [Patescibacteria group bacterium]|nr:DUF5011 domain-containing protein [Patescibacteria group bacterium]